MTAVEKVRDRLRRAAAALEAAQIPYAVVGGNAVAALVSEVDEAAVRNTRDVDILLRRDDLERAKEALGKAGFIYRHVKSIDMFLDGPGTRARDAASTFTLQPALSSFSADEVIATARADMFVEVFGRQLAFRLSGTTG